MHIPRLLLRRFLVWLGMLIASLLFLLWGAPVAAQNVPAAPAQHFGGGSQLAIPPEHAQSQKLQVPEDVRSALEAKPAEVKGKAQMKVVPRGGQRCYTVRTYQFEQVNPGADATRFKDYQTCQPSTEARLKGTTGFNSGTGGTLVTPQGFVLRPSLRNCGFGYGDTCPSMTTGGKPITR